MTGQELLIYWVQFFGFILGTFLLNMLIIKTPNLDKKEHKIIAFSAVGVAITILPSILLPNLKINAGGAFWGLIISLIVFLRLKLRQALLSILYTAVVYFIIGILLAIITGVFNLSFDRVFLHTVVAPVGLVVTCAIGFLLVVKQKLPWTKVKE